MSILKTTRSGINYAKWCEDLHEFSVRALAIANNMYHSNKKASMWKIVECYTIDGKAPNGNWKVFTKEFKFLATWTVDEFKKAFIEKLENEKPSDCFIEEIPIKLEIVVSDEHT